MINKQNLWFITLFSLIIILGIYYVTIIDKEQTLATIADNINENITETANVKADESSILVALRVKEDEDVLAKMEELQTILLDEKSSLLEKNNAYESLQNLNANKGKEAEIEKMIKNDFSLNSFVKIINDKISITIVSDKHDTKLANDIIIKVQKEFKQRVYPSIKFQKQ